MSNMPNPNPILITNEQKSNRRKLFKLHSWVGFHLAFIMAVVLATGTIATLTHEIDWLIYKEMRVTPGDKKVSWQTMTNAVREYAPESKISSIYALEGDYLAYRADVRDNYNKRYFIHINQWTGEVTGETGLVTVQRVFRDLHRYLFTPSFIGLPIVGSMAFILLISLYTGLKTSRNWRTLMTRIRFDKGSRVLIGDAHKAAGLWGIWFLILMAATGIWYLVEFSGVMANYATKTDDYSFRTTPATMSSERLKSVGNVIDIPKTNDIIQVAQTAFPEIGNNITRIFFPIKPDQAIRVLGQQDYSILRPRANQVYIDPESLDVIKVQRSQDITWVAWLNNTADPLHFGTFGGLFTKVIWFIFGLALTGLSVSGVVLTWRRLKTKAVSKAQFKTLPVLLLCVVSGYFYWYPIYQAPKRSHSELMFTQTTDKEFDIELHVGLNEQNKPDGKIRLLTKADNAIANIENVSIVLSTQNDKQSEAKTFKLKKFDSTSLYTTKLSPELLVKSDKLTLDFELHTGKKIQADWKIDLYK